MKIKHEERKEELIKLLDKLNIEYKTQKELIIVDLSKLDKEEITEVLKIIDTKNVKRQGSITS